MSNLLSQYAEVAGQRAVDQLRCLAEPLQGKRIVHVNSTKEGGGVAEILHKLVPLSRELGLDVSWEVITGEGDFYVCTKSFHNALQGDPIDVSRDLLDIYEETNRRNADQLRDTLATADVVFIHDPQPAPLLTMIPERKGTWIWRCHIDMSRPHEPVWRYLKDYVVPYDASIFSLVDFAKPLPHPVYLIPPAIDPLSAKNQDLPEERIDEVRAEFGIDPSRAMVVQVSRFDRFKDPVGVVQAYQMAKKSIPGLQLVLAGGTATDDPEGAEVLAEVNEAADGDPDIKVLLLPPDAHETINALQQASDIVIQKSTKEGFGLTVTEGLWKGKAVVAGNVGGIRLQITNGHRGYLVDSPEGCAYRMSQLILRKRFREAMGRRARDFIRENFLLTRLLRDHLTVVHGVVERNERIHLRSAGVHV